MERGATLIKFNAGKGMFGKKSDASRMVERWVVLNTKLGGPNTELAWGDPTVAQSAIAGAHFAAASGAHDLTTVSVAAIFDRSRGALTWSLMRS